MQAEPPGALACYNLQERLMPYVRAEVAKRLARQQLRQSRIAEHLGVSQAMVSKYLRSMIRPPAGVPAPLLQSVVERAATSVQDQEQKGRLPEWCPVCPQLWGRGAMSLASDIHLSECLRGDQPPERDEAVAVLDNVRAAAQRLQGAEFVPLAPEVNINLAMAVARAHDARGVAALPGRIVEARGELVALSDPEFGASNHLAQVLLRVRKSAANVRAVMCVKENEAVRRALRAAGLQFRVLKRGRGELSISLPARDVPDALIDPGDFGIEPITYVFGETALDVVEKARRVLRHLGPAGVLP